MARGVGLPLAYHDRVYFTLIIPLLAATRLQNVRYWKSGSSLFHKPTFSCHSRWDVLYKPVVRFIIWSLDSSVSLPWLADRLRLQASHVHPLSGCPESFRSGGKSKLSFRLSHISRYRLLTLKCGSGRLTLLQQVGGFLNVIRQNADRRPLSGKREVQTEVPACS